MFLVQKSTSSFVRDETHTLPILKYSRKTGQSDQNTNYLLPSKKDLQRGKIVVRTQICSTVASNRPALHWFLNWKTSPVRHSSHFYWHFLWVFLFFFFMYSSSNPLRVP